MGYGGIEQGYMFFIDNYSPSILGNAGSTPGLCALNVGQMLYETPPNFAGTFLYTLKQLAKVLPPEDMKPITVLEEGMYNSEKKARIDEAALVKKNREHLYWARTTINGTTRETGYRHEDIMKDLQLLFCPVGVTYTQWPGSPKPEDMWPGTKWKDLSYDWSSETRSFAGLIPHIYDEDIERDRYVWQVPANKGTWSSCLANYTFGADFLSLHNGRGDTQWTDMNTPYTRVWQPAPTYPKKRIDTTDPYYYQGHLLYMPMMPYISYIRHRLAEQYHKDHPTAPWWPYGGMDSDTHIWSEFELGKLPLRTRRAYEQNKEGYNLNGMAPLYEYAPQYCFRDPLSFYGYGGSMNYKRAYQPLDPDGYPLGYDDDEKEDAKEQYDKYHTWVDSWPEVCDFTAWPENYAVCLWERVE